MMRHPQQAATDYLPLNASEVVLLIIVLLIIVLLIIVRRHRYFVVLFQGGQRSVMS